jgi:hypothetical protein
MHRDLSTVYLQMMDAAAAGGNDWGKNGIISAGSLRNRRCAFCQFHPAP